MSNQRRQRRPFLSIGMLMRRFSRALTQRYVGDEDPFASQEEETSEWDETAEAPSQTRRARAVAKPVQSVDDAIKAAERITPTPAPRPVQRANAPKPAPPKPVVPPTPAPVPVVNPTPAPVQRAPDPTPAASTSPKTESPASSQQSSSSEGFEWPEGVPRTWNGQPIPVSNTPTPPALKAWIQREREREVRRKEILAERKDKLLSELPPPPEDPNAPRGRRLRPRGHTGVDYVNTASLRGDEPHQPVQRNFDFSLGDSGEAPPAVPREPSSPRGGQPANDDDETSTPVEGVESSPDYASALEAAIQRAENYQPPSTMDFDAPDAQPSPRRRRAIQNPVDSSDVVGDVAEISTSTGEVQRAENQPNAPVANVPPVNNAPTPPVVRLVQRAEDSSAPEGDESPIQRIPDPSTFATQTDEADFGADDWDIDDAPDMPEVDFAAPDVGVQRDIDDKKLTQNTLMDEEDDISVNSDVVPASTISLQRQAAIDAAIQRAEAPSAPSEVPAWDPSVMPLSSLQAQFFAPKETTSPESKPNVMRSVDPVETPAAGDLNTVTPIQRQAVDSPSIFPTSDSASSQTDADSPIPQVYDSAASSTPLPVQRQAAIDAAIQRAESITPPDVSVSNAPVDSSPSRKSSKRKGSQNQPPTPSSNPETSANLAPIQRTAVSPAESTASSPQPTPETHFSSEPNQHTAALPAEKTSSPIQRMPEISSPSEPSQHTAVSPAERMASPTQPESSQPTATSPIQRVSDGASPAQVGVSETPQTPASPVRPSSGYQAALEAAIQRAEAPTPPQTTEIGETVTEAPQTGLIQRVAATVEHTDDEISDTTDSLTPIQRQAVSQTVSPSGEAFAVSENRPAEIANTEAPMQFSGDSDGSTPTLTSDPFSATDAPIQRTSDERVSPQKFTESGATFPTAPSQPEVFGSSAPMSYQTAVDLAIQRAEAPSDSTATPFSQSPVSSKPTAQPFMPPTRTVDATPTAPKPTQTPTTPAPSATSTPTANTPQSNPIQRAAIDAAIERAEAITPTPRTPQTFSPPTRTMGGVSSAAPTSTGSQPVPVMRQAAPSAETFSSESAIPDQTVTLSSPTESVYTPLSASSPTESPYTPASTSEAIQRVVSSQAGQSTSAMSSPDGSPAQRAAAAQPVARQAAIDAAIQRAEAIPTPSSRPFVPTARKLTAATTDAPAVQARGFEPVAGELPAAAMPYDVDEVDVPFGAIQRDADDFSTWDDFSEVTPSDRPDLHQAMAAAGMVPPPTSTPIQRTSDYLSAKESAISRAESVAPSARPDLFQALKAAGMVSDANAAKTNEQSRANSSSVSVTEQAPMTPMVQRGLDTQPENQSDSEQPPNEGIPHDIDVDKLAHDVYRVLRDKLRVEAERRAK